MGNERIKLTDSSETILSKMSEGNPGTAHILMKMMDENALIDPNSALGSLGGIIQLDSADRGGARVFES